MSSSLCSIGPQSHSSTARVTSRLTPNSDEKADIALVGQHARFVPITNFARHEVRPGDLDDHSQGRGPPSFRDRAFWRLSEPPAAHRRRCYLVARQSFASERTC